MGGGEEFYVGYFQEPGRAEAEIEPDVRGRLAGFYAALSAGTMPAPGRPGPHFVAPGGRLRDRFPTGPPPSWLSRRELDVHAAEFDGCGHWIQRERPDEVNRLLTDWLASLPPA
ncbi:alpha/beta fold hydrolase [Actinomadura sediminis]|uniref:Alpha/beta fold hydrolase n=1 Tax=Actinomadura sediminis TaxID=1038904 RepID=A0ABW3EV71_9ACTN